MIASKRQIALGGIVLTLLFAFAFQVAGSPVSFDGAMNLQVAASLVDGHGYARFYDQWIHFPDEVQTNAPFVLPASLMFALFGVTLLSAQLVSIVYAAALVGAIIWLVRPEGGVAAALIAASVVLISPDFSRFAANGYGEVPGLVWFLLGLGFFCRAQENQRRLYFFAAGMCLGLAVLTKTVMLMPVGILLALSGATLLLERRWHALATKGFAFIVPIALFEAWRAVSLGGLAPFSSWWANQFRSILAQAGVRDEFRNTPEWTEKLFTHASILADAVSLPVWLLPVLALVPVGLALLALAELKKTGSSRSTIVLMTTLAVAIVAYFAWWLLVTPTEKAWHRRIFNGLLLLTMAAPLLFEQVRRRVPESRIATLVAVLPILALTYSGIVNFKLFETDNRWSEIRQTVNFMRAAPDSTRFYGFGWYSAPVFSLYSGRRVHDLNVWKQFIDANDGEHYLLVDANMIQAGVRERALRNLDHRTIIDESPWAEVVAITSDFRFQPMPAFDTGQLSGYVNFLDSEYPLVQGFHKPEGDGWRWVEAAARIALKSPGHGRLVVHGYLPSLDKFRIADSREKVSIAASIGDCALGIKWIEQSGNFELTWALDACSDMAGEFEIVTLRANAGITGVDRQLSWIAHSIGFSD